MSYIIRIENASKHYGGLKAVDNVNFDIEEGKVYGIIGPNGAGKTTLFNMIVGVVPVTKGKIYFYNKEITGMQPDKIAKQGIGRTFQNIKLFNNLSVLENVKMGFHTKLKTNLFDAVFHMRTYKDDESYASEGAYEVIKQVGLEKYYLEKAGNLPYGMQRRVEIARALALKPKILLLDEPTAGMNPTETQELLNLIDELRQQKYTVVVIEHDMRFVMRLCERIAVLNFGVKIFEGTPEEVKKAPQVWEAYFGREQKF